MLDSLFNKVGKSANLLKRASKAGLSFEYCKIFKKTYFEEHQQTATTIFFSNLEGYSSPIILQDGSKTYVDFF